MVDLLNPLDSSFLNATNVTNVCDFALDFGGNYFSLVLSIVLMVVGLIFLIFGSKYFKYTLFGFSFLFGAGLGFYVTTLASDCNTKVGLIVAFIMGIMIGAVTVKLWKVALVVMGAGVGFIVWTTLKALFGKFFTDLSYLEDDYILYGSLAAIMIILGLLALKLEKLWLLIGTPIIGSFMFVQGIDYFIPQDVNVFQILNNVKGDGTGCSISACYVLYAMVAGLSLVGGFIQYRWTSEYAEERREREAEEAEEEEEERPRKKRKSKKKKKKSKKKRREKRRRRHRHRRSSSDDY